MNVVEHFWKVGEKIRIGFDNAAKSVGAEKYLNILSDYDVKPAFSFNDGETKNSMLARTFILQKMCEKGILMPYVVPSLSHKDSDILFAIRSFEESMYELKNAIEGPGLNKSLVGPVTKGVFRKYN